VTESPAADPALERAKAQGAELGRFLVVGLSAVGTDFLVYMALVRVLPTAVAKAISFAAGAILSFVLNRLFVFRAKGKGKVSTQAGAFVLLYATSLLLNMGVNAGFLALAVPKAVSWLFATGSSTVANFLGMKFIVFAEAKKKSALVKESS
jgi:putative flippase GtrA